MSPEAVAPAGSARYTSRPKECALCFPEGEGFRVVGGMRIGYPDNHHTHFLFANNPVGNVPFVGIRIFFPTVEVPYASFETTQGKPQPQRIITIKLRLGTWTSSAEILSDKRLATLPPRTNAKDSNWKLVLLHFKLKDGERAMAENFGMPAVCKTPDDQAILDDDAPIEGVMSLWELCRQREYFILVDKFEDKVAAVNNQLQDYFPSEIPRVMPYANGEWNLNRYGREIPQFARNLPYEVNFKFDSHEDCAAAITQGVVQDAFYLIQDIYKIRRCKVECAFLKIEEDSHDATAPAFHVLAWHHFDKSELVESLSRLLKSGARLGLAFTTPPAEKKHDVKHWRADMISLDRYKSTGCDFAMKIHRPFRRSDPGQAIRNQLIMAFNTFDEDVAKARVNAAKVLWEQPVLNNLASSAAGAYHEAVMGLYKADLLTGSGFSTLIYPPEPVVGLELDDTDDADASTKTTKATTIERTKHSLPRIDIFQYSSDISYQLLKLIEGAVGPATWERFRQYMTVNRLGVIPIVSIDWSDTTQMSSHVAFLFMMSRPIYCSAPTHVATTNFANRLFELSANFSKTIGCRLPLIVRGYNVQKDLDVFEAVVSKGFLGNLEKETTTWRMHLSPCEWLLKVVGAGGYELAVEDPEPLHAMRVKYLTEPRYHNLREFVRGALGFYKEQPSVPEWKETLEEAWKAANHLLSAIVLEADAVCTTPYLSTQPPFSYYNQDHARGVVLNEADAMSVADAVMVMGSGCRPVVLSGDREQLPLPVSTHGQIRHGRVVNMLSQQAKISVLKKLQRSGWPCFILTNQDGRGGGRN